MILICHEETTDDDGTLAPCDQHAVGRRFDPEQLERGSYPVCVEHVRAPMAVLRDEYGALQRLRAALPHLQPTVPNTVDALDALTVGSVIRAECPDGTYVAELAQEGWDLAGYSYPSSAGNLAAIVGVTEWTIVWSPA